MSPLLSRFHGRLLLILTLLAGCSTGNPETSDTAQLPEEGTISVTRGTFGTTPEGERVYLYTMRNAQGAEVEIITYGGNVRAVRVPDRDGEIEDVLLGYDSLDPYIEVYSRFGAIVGRYANRIARGRFTLDGTEYVLATNNGNNHLHGGLRGFDKRVWNHEVVEENGHTKLRLTYLSPDGEEGYPGNLQVTVDYSLTDDNALVIDYRAMTDEATHLNLTNHSFFDLSAGAAETILDHVVELNADRYTPVDPEQIPTGALEPVSGTPFDFREPKPIRRDFEAAGGYDHNYVLNKNEPDELTLAARVSEPGSGRTLEVFTTEPGLQFYTGNVLDGSITGKNGRRYVRNAGLCLEAQHFPDSPNRAAFPSTVLRPGEVYLQTTIYRFGVGG